MILRRRRRRAERHCYQNRTLIVDNSRFGRNVKGDEDILLKFPVDVYYILTLERKKLSLLRGQDKLCGS